MAHKIGFGKLERTVLSVARLPPDLRAAIIHFKNQFRHGANLVVFQNRENVLPATAHGQCYYEFQVGAARAPTAEFPTTAGRRRIVGLSDAGNNLLKIYFTDEHYAAGSWFQLQWP
jgi:guanyl-specific ribonuclease Sa